MELKECKCPNHVGTRNTTVDMFSGGHPKTSDRLQIYCKQCMRDIQRKWRKEHPGYHSKYTTKYGAKYRAKQGSVAYMLQHIKRRVRDNNLEFNLTPDDIKIPDKCPVLGIPLFFKKGSATDNTPSIDRIDPSRGYVRDNIQIISQRANRIKNDGTPEEHLLIYEYLSNL